ncbi:3528_t:CDS:2 [Acaulospora colombiana]|uniref:3528_t:CDS:1 n=1 Tax=Acaulospora colombiana TaxID=27376 RepID=A0ACA9NVZ7_9GLOM|nr:3528_t:CDS:2 [Acaulospora colombiana]
MYTAASATAGSFAVALDGSPYGSFSISKEEGQDEPCAARLIVDINSLPATQHTLKVTVIEGLTDGGLNFVFAGFGLSSVSSNSSRLTNPTAAVTPTPKSNIGAIVGGVLGGLAGLSLIVLGLFFLRRRRIAAAKEASQPVSPSKSVEDDQQTLCGIEADKQAAAKV